MIEQDLQKRKYVGADWFLMDDLASLEKRYIEECGELDPKQKQNKRIKHGNKVRRWRVVGCYKAARDPRARGHPISVSGPSAVGPGEPS